jgi:hypothetical protein
VAQDRELVHCHAALIFTIDALVSDPESEIQSAGSRKRMGTILVEQASLQTESDTVGMLSWRSSHDGWSNLQDWLTEFVPLAYAQTSCRDHICGHAITDKHDYVLCLLGNLGVADGPVGLSNTTTGIGESSDVVSRLVQGDLSVSLGSNLDQCRCLCSLSEEILIPSEVPPLNGRFGDLQVRSGGLAVLLLAILCDGESERLIGSKVAGYYFAAILRSVDLDEVSIARRQIPLGRVQELDQPRDGYRTIDQAGSRIDPGGIHSLERDMHRDAGMSEQIRSRWR